LIVYRLPIDCILVVYGLLIGCLLFAQWMDTLDTPYLCDLHPAY